MASWNLNRSAVLFISGSVHRFPRRRASARVFSFAALLLAGPVAVTPPGAGLTEATRRSGEAGAAPQAGETDTAEALKALIKQARYREAEEGARRLLARVESESGPDSLPAAGALDLLVEAMARGGKTKDPATRELGERAVRIKEGLLGPGSTELAGSLVNLGRIFITTGDFAAAKPPLERARGIYETALGPEHPEVAGALGLLGHLLTETGAYAEARVSLERALSIQEKSLGPEHLDLARTLNNLGLLMRNMGEFHQARLSEERALRILEKGLGPDHPDLAAVLTNLANALADIGDYGGAKPLYERALRLREQALGPEHPSVAITLTNLGQFLHETGDLLEARRIFERALQIREKTLPPEHPTLASTLNNLGLLLAATGEEAGARAFYERALTIREKALGPEHPDVASTVHNLAGLIAATGDDAGARRLYERAVAIRTKVLGPESPFLAASLSGLATVLRHLGDDEGAEALLERALAIREKQLGPDHPEVAASLRDLAELHWDRGHWESARAMADRASRILDRHVRETLAALPERAALRWVASRERPEEVLFSGLLFPGDATSTEQSRWLDACWNWTLRRRGVVLDELAARRRTVAQGESHEASEARLRLVEGRRRLAALWVKGADPEHPERYGADLDAARRSKEEAETVLARQSARFRRDSDLLRVDVDDVARALPAGSALVEVVRVPVRQPRGKKNESHDIALILGRGGAREHVDLGPSQQIDKLVKDWREALQDSSGVTLSGLADPEQLVKMNAAGRRLRNAAWDPIADVAGSANILFLVPDGALHQVNFEALPAKAGGYLAEALPDVHLLSSGRELVRLREAGGGMGKGAGKAEVRAPAGRGLLALGAPDFDAGETARLAKLDSRSGQAVFRGQRPACSAIARTRWPPLRESLREVQRIGALFKGGERVLILTAEGASEERFKREAPGKRILHLATHGFFLQGQCNAPPRIDAAAHEKLPDRGSEPSHTARNESSWTAGVENPLLLSGLILAGANHAGESVEEGEDGVLTAEELAALDLGSAELAVLSACDTGRGAVETGEGVLGLRRALELAGVRSVVMSLWPVPDRQAQRWMVSFYRKRLSGGTIIESSRRASLDVLARLRQEGRSEHPYLWAGFVAAGDWR